MLAYKSLNRLVAWVVEDPEFSTGCGQALSQDGRYVLTRVQLSIGYTAFLNQTPVDHDSYLDGAHSLDTFCSDLIKYHSDTNTTRQVHVPWDPGKTSFLYSLKNSAWGQAEFQEGRNVMSLAYIHRVGLVSWARVNGLGPT
jgi:hypothetical protein